MEGVGVLWVLAGSGVFIILINVEADYADEADEGTGLAGDTSPKLLP